MFEQYELRMTSGKVDAVKVRTLDVGSLSEACVVDDARGALYVAEEDVALWRYDLDPSTGAKRTAVDTVGAGRLTADIEGLSLARGPGGAGVLVVSSQGDSTYSVYDLDGRHAFRGTFAVERRSPVDGASDTDGLAIGSGSFGPAFPNGLLVVHDASNDGGRRRVGRRLQPQVRPVRPGVRAVPVTRAGPNHSGAGSLRCGSLRCGSARCGSPQVGEPELDLTGGRLRAVRAVDDVLGDAVPPVVAEVTADRPRRCHGRVGRTAAASGRPRSRAPPRRRRPRPARRT